MEDDPELRGQINLYRNEKAEDEDWESDEEEVEKGRVKKEELVTEGKEPVPIQTQDEDESDNSLLM